MKSTNAKTHLYYNVYIEAFILKKYYCSYLKH